MCQTNVFSKNIYYTASLVINMQIKSTMRYKYVLITLSKNNNKLMITCAGKDVEHLEPLHIFGINGK